MKHLYKIYYSAILGCCLWIVPEISQATHLLGGEIIATATNCQSYTYDIEIRLFRDSGSDVELPGNEFYVGHGESVLLSTGNFGLKEPVSYANGQYQVDVFTLRHTYPGPGVYTLYARMFNRTSEVANMSNSVQTPFYIETQITIDPLLGCSSTPELTGLPIPQAYAGSTYSQLLLAEDVDGDSLSYELVTPLQNVNEEVEGYRLPHKFDIRFAPQPSSSSGDSAPELFISEQGELVWDAPNLGGNFTLALRVNEWRKVGGEWLKMGYVTRDMTVRVQDTLNNTDATDYITSSQEEIVSQPKVNIYPNPTTGPFTVEITEDRWLGGTLSIFNIIGQKMLEEPIVLGTSQYDLADASQGVYFLTLQKGEQKKSIRFMKR
jgi:hypothetical protein